MSKNVSTSSPLKEYPRDVQLIELVSEAEVTPKLDPKEYVFTIGVSTVEPKENMVIPSPLNDKDLCGVPTVISPSLVNFAVLKS